MGGEGEGNDLDAVFDFGADIGNAARRILSQVFASSLSSSRTQARVWMELLRPWETLRAFS